MAKFHRHKIDLSRFVALGDSVTAGYKDAALFYEGQVNSYPNLMAEQFNLVAACNFKQALMDPDSAGIGFFGNSRLVLKKFTDHSHQRLCYLHPQGDLEAFAKNIYSSNGPFNNLGIPGAKAITTIFPGYGNKKKGEGNYNPYFTRMASDPEKASVLSDAMAIDPTFFSLFIGNNDVMAYALSGGTLDTITPIAGDAGVGFEASLNYIVNTLNSKGAKGVVSNLPGISSIPFFTTISYNGLLLDSAQAELLKARYSFASVNFRAGLNPFLVEDNSVPNGIRQIEKGEFILLEIMLDENKFNYLKGFNPLPKKYYLSKSQIREIEKTLASCNTIIKNIASEKNLAFVDTDQLLKTMKPDRVYSETSLGVKYKTGGVFSLDGLHINPLGQSLLANEFIGAINQTYGLHIPKVNITRFRDKLLY
jgi:lysophospholipase L1-like esterase